MAIKLTVNNTAYAVDVPAEMPLLWVIRDVIGLTGTKDGGPIAINVTPYFFANNASVCKDPSQSFRGWCG